MTRGYSGFSPSEMKEELKQLMATAKDETTRKAIGEMISKI